MEHAFSEARILTFLPSRTPISSTRSYIFSTGIDKSYLYTPPAFIKASGIPYNIKINTFIYQDMNRLVPHEDVHFFKINLQQ